MDADDEVTKLKTQLAAMTLCIAGFVDGFECAEHGGLEACPYPDVEPARVWWLRGYEMAAAIRERRFLRQEVARLRHRLGEDSS